MQDDALGRVLNRLTAEDVLFVASDHGFLGAKECFYIIEYLCRRGLLERGVSSISGRKKVLRFGREAAQKMHLLGFVRKVRKMYTSRDSTPVSQKRGSH